MRSLLVVLVLVAGSAVQAFDSEAWLRRRADFAAAAERMTAAYEKCAAAVDAPAENLLIPVESWPDGSVKTSVAASAAQLFLAEGLVWGRGVTVRRFREDGSEDGTIRAEDCVIDRNRRAGWTKGLATFAFGGETTVSGRGVYFDLGERYLSIASETTVVRGDDRLTGERGCYDHARGVVMFEGSVAFSHRVGGDVYDIGSDRAWAFIEGTNSLRRVVALGGVAIKGAGRRGGAARAVYTAGDGKLVLYGDGDSPAWLEQTGERAGRLEGRSIAYWTKSGQVEVLGALVSVNAEGAKLPGGKGGGHGR